jgi:hypothetical protein
VTYPYALERPHDPGSPHLERDAVPSTPAPTSAPSSSLEESPASAEAPAEAPARARRRAPAGERPRGRGGARKVRQDPALDAELAGIVPPPVDES